MTEDQKKPSSDKQAIRDDASSLGADKATESASNDTPSSPSSSDNETPTSGGSQVTADNQTPETQDPSAGTRTGSQAGDEDIKTLDDYYKSLDLSSLPENAHIPPPPPPRKPKDSATADADPQKSEKARSDKEKGPSDTENKAENKADGKTKGSEKPITLLDHLGELRSRLIRIFIITMLAFFACYSVAELLFYYLSLPLVKVMPEGSQLIFTSIPEGFFVYIKVAFIAAVFVASPYIFYQVWAFISPGLYAEERRLIIPLSFFSAFFFISGALFCYLLVFPFAFPFFMGYSTEYITAMPTLNEYLSFSLTLLIAFGLIFEMPLFAFFLARMGIITADWLRKQRRYAALIIFVVAAILTPPDVISQALMAVPMLFLYEVSILVAVTFQKRKKA